LAQSLITTSNSDCTPTCDVGVTGATDIVQEVGVDVDVAVEVAVGVAVEVGVRVGVLVGVAVSVGVSVAAAWQVTEALVSAGSIDAPKLSANWVPPCPSLTRGTRVSAVVPGAWHCICNFTRAPVKLLSTGGKVAQP
jgi:hypothetical protein